MTMITTEHGGFVVPPCPSWCRLPADHELHGDKLAVDYDGAVVRRHETITAELVPDLGDAPVTVRVERAEVVGRLDGTDSEPAAVDLLGVSLTAAEARAVAAALTAAAETVDLINKAQDDG